MLQASVQLYRNAYSGLSKPMWWLALVMFINRSGTMVIPFLSVYLTSRGFTLSQAGYVLAAFGLGSILGGYLGGVLTDRWGHLRVQIYSLFLNGILFLVLERMQTFWQITACIFILSSIGEAFRPANSAAVAAYSNESNRIRSYALNRLAINLGWAIGPAIGGLLSSVNFSLLFWADGITCIGASILLYFWFPEVRKAQEEKKEQPAFAPLRSAYKDRFFLWGMFFLFLVGICFFQIFSIFPVYYERELGLEKTMIGLLLAMNGLIIAVIEMVLVYKLEHRRPAAIYMMYGSMFIAISYLILEVHPGLSMAIFSMVVITIGEMLLFPFMNNFWVNRSDERNRGQYAAVYTMSFSAAIVLAPTFATQIAERAGFPILWLVDCMICLSGAAGFYILQKRMLAHG
jgi:predicted MFS family arabinose efflux permease